MSSSMAGSKILIRCNHCIIKKIYMVFWHRLANYCVIGSNLSWFKPGWHFLKIYCLASPTSFSCMFPWNIEEEDQRLLGTTADPSSPSSSYPNPSRLFTSHPCPSQLYTSPPFCWSLHVFSSLWSNVSMLKSIKNGSLKVFAKWHRHCHCLCLFVGQVMFSI